MGRPRKNKENEVDDGRESEPVEASVTVVVHDTTVTEGVFMPISQEIKIPAIPVTVEGNALVEGGVLSDEEEAAIKFLIQWTGHLRRKSNDRGFRSAAQNNIAIASNFLDRIEKMKG
jgi:hypothetical protein